MRLSRLFDRIIYSRLGIGTVSFLAAVLIVFSMNYDEIELTFLHQQNESLNLTGVEVQTLVDEDTYTVSGVPSTVSVILTGPSADLQVFQNSGTPTCVVDLRKYNAGEYDVEVSVDSLPSSISAQVNPQSVHVTIALNVEKEFTLTPDILVGSDQKESDWETPSLSTTKITVKGTQEQIDSIRTVKAIVDTTGQTSDFTGTATIVAYDGSGHTVDVEFDMSSVQATVKKSSE